MHHPLDRANRANSSIAGGGIGSALRTLAMQTKLVRTSSFGRFVSSSAVRMMVAAGSAAAVLAIAPAAFAKTATACPANMAHIGNTCVDKWEASLVEVMPDGSEAPFSPYSAPNGHQVKAVSRPGVIPQAHISMNEGQRACKAAGKRLCHAKEWKNACKGPSQTRYPYGNKHVDYACVDTNRTSPMRSLNKGAFNHENMNDPRLNQLANTVEPTGTLSSCTNGYDVHDMVGNVHEWVDDAAFHGGYYLDTKINNEGCDYKTTAHAPNYYDYSTGFRCCADEGTAPEIEEEQGVPENKDSVARFDTIRPAKAPHAALDFSEVNAKRGNGERRWERAASTEVADRESMFPAAG
jgi:sulfatase modifying factor 1